MLYRQEMVPALRLSFRQCRWWALVFSFGVLLAACGEGSAGVASALPEVADATLSELTVLNEVGVPTDPDYTIVVYEVIGTTLTGRELVGGETEVSDEFEREITAEQLASISDEVQAAGFLIFDVLPESSDDVPEGGCREIGRFVIDAFWDNDEGFFGSMPRAEFQDLGRCNDVEFNLTGDATQLLATLEEIRTN